MAGVRGCLVRQSRGARVVGECVGRPADVYCLGEGWEINSVEQPIDSCTHACGV